MARGTAIAAIVLVVTVVIAYCWADGPQPAPTLAATATSGPVSTPHLTGVGSCSASSCHGSPLSNDAPAWNTAFTKWATEDRHSQAYAVLFGPLAAQIEDDLNRPSGKSGPPAYEDARCLGCHTMESPGGKQLHEFVMDGVGCESCHGPAEVWLSEHTAKNWKPQHGMLDTKNATVRAQQCVKCHVGASPRGDGATRDVNHDLIAAGHPRLAFELTSYLEAMPPHWATQVNGTPKEDSLHVWTVGRVVALQTALELRSQRWNAANAAPQTPPVLQPVWPEFAELDCYSCHRPFQPGEGGQWPVVTELASPRKLGQPTRNLWYETMMGAVMSQNWPDHNIELTPLDEWAPWGKPDVAAIHAAVNKLDAISQSLVASRDSAEKLTSIITETAINAGNWDEAAQQYLALAALAAHRHPTLELDRKKELEEALVSLRATVQFPFQFNSPRAYSPGDFETAADRVIEMLSE